MPREYKTIRWNKRQRSSLNSAVRRYNNAIRRAAKQNPELAEFLPSEVKYKDLKKGITTARALQNTVNRLVRATKPGAMELVKQDDGSVVTKYERREFNILKSVRERKKKQRAKEKNVAVPDTGHIGSKEQAEITPDKRKASEYSAKGLRRFLETQERIMNRSSVENARRYFKNYISALLSVFGGFSDYDDSIDLIQEKILKLASSNFGVLQDAIDEAPSIEYIYDPVLRDAKMAKILEYWKAA